LFAWWLNDETDVVRTCRIVLEPPKRSERVFVHYNDLLEDLDREMRRVAAFLTIEIDETRWQDLVSSCTFAEMKERGNQIGDLDRAFVGGIDTFLHRGSNARWRDVLTTDELTEFDRRSRELIPRDAITWTKSGRTAVHP
jgi:aryl sulfotransferase